MSLKLNLPVSPLLLIASNKLSSLLYSLPSPSASCLNLKTISKRCLILVVLSGASDLLRLSKTCSRETYTLFLTNTSFTRCIPSLPKGSVVLPYSDISYILFPTFSLPNLSFDSAFNLLNFSEKTPSS